MDILPDLLSRNLTVVFCGTAPGRTSAAQRAYYAHPRNRFWRTLYECHLTDRLLDPGQYQELPTYGIGLTDLCKHTSGNDDELPKESLACQRLLLAIERYEPRCVAFTSRHAGRALCGSLAKYGRQAPRGETEIYILPTTSPRWGQRWWEQNKHHWQNFANDAKAWI
ncbi:mismatch-specific DNA-glycosylase [Bradyrhizobium stylosanthis]|uniref:mismatch-specific DNA-glycosylase n=1 Tax=Bradyrhizobium stylosanthis TaxID=1803665 RepID=UPI0011A2612D